MKDSLYVLGAGGHAKVIISVCLEMGMHIDGVLDEDEHTWGTKILGISVTGDLRILEKSRSKAIIGIGNNSIRRKIYERFNEYVDWQTFIHPDAYVHHSVKIGKGSVIMIGAVVQPDVRIGNHVIINTSASVDHDCVINDYVHIAPGVNLAGGVEVGDGTFFGISSSAVPYVKIGDWSVVGAGSVVINNIPSNKMVVGVPAKIKKELQNL